MVDSYRDFVGELEVYKKFDEKINGDNILLVHASAPDIVKEKCHLRIKDDNKEIDDIVWKREWIDIGIFVAWIVGENDLSKEGYFIIKGHTPLKDMHGFIYNKEQNYLNIAGGCSYYASGDFDVDHVPLVEVHDKVLDILVFNHNNQIIDGYYFDGEIKTMAEAEIKEKEIFLDHSLDNNGEKNKQLIKEILAI
jgi:hypothetical protein